MRTTLDIDEDVLIAAKERARRERRSAGAVISELAREALNGHDRPAESERRPAHRVFRPFPSRGDGTVVTNELIDKLREDGPY